MWASTLLCRAPASVIRAMLPPSMHYPHPGPAPSMEGAPASRRGRQPRHFHPRTILAHAPRSVDGRHARILRKGPISHPPSVFLCIFVLTTLTSLAYYISTSLSSPPKFARTSHPCCHPYRPASPWGITTGSLHRRSTCRLPSVPRPHRILAAAVLPTIGSCLATHAPRKW